MTHPSICLVRATITVLLSLLTLTANPCRAATTARIPTLQFTTRYQSATMTGNVFTSPHGVDDRGGSPFIVSNGANIQSFSASGTPLLVRNMSDSLLMTGRSVMPFTNNDANGKPLLVAPTKDGSVVAIEADTLKTKWTYVANNCRFDDVRCSHFALVHLDGKHTNCSSGAGGASLLHCTAKTGACFVTVVDMDNGKECHPPMELPAVLTFMDPQHSLHYQVFPSGGALQIPMIVAVTATNTMLGINGATGEVEYQFPIEIPPQPSCVGFFSFALGSSPSNELFAYSFNCGAKDTLFSFRNITDGSLHLATRLKLPGEFNSLFFESSWSPGHTKLGGITVSGWDMAQPSSTVVSISALNGWQEVKHIPDCLGYVPFVNFADMWTVGLCAETDGYRILGIAAPTLAINYFFSVLPKMANPRFANGGLTSFTFADGTPGLAGFEWATDGDETLSGHGYLAVYSL